jgi:protease secretion system membrane fusion protein
MNWFNFFSKLKYRKKTSNLVKHINLGDEETPLLESTIQAKKPEMLNERDTTIRTGIIILFLGFGSFMLWISFAPLDEGVPAMGSVAIDTKKKTIQHLMGGIIRNVFVKEGQMVKTGDTLIVMEDAATKARFEETRQQYFGDRALESRLIAEQGGSPDITFHEDLEAMKEDLLVDKHIKNQIKLFLSRRSELAADLQVYKESIQGQEAMIQGFNSILESRKQQLKIMNEQLDGIRSLVLEGYAAKNLQRDLESKVAQINADIADTISSTIKAQKAIGEFRQRILSRQEAFKKDVNEQMARVKMEVDAVGEKYKALEGELKRTEIKSPVDGQVVGLQFQTGGGVVQPGQKILDVVPLNEGLLVEVKVPPNLIDRVSIDQAADIRFDSFANSPKLVVEGKVDSISKDLIYEPNVSTADPNSSYYLARVSVTPKGLQTLGNRPLQSGMPVQVIIKTGERTMLTYFLHPFMKRFAESLKEN